MSTLHCSLLNREQWRAFLSNAPRTTLSTEEHHEKAEKQAAVRTCHPNAHARAVRSNGTVVQWTHWDRSVEIIWQTSTTRGGKTIFSVTSTGIKLVPYTDRGREVDRVAKQMVQRTEEERACRLGEQKRDLLHHLLRRFIAKVEKDEGTSAGLCTFFESSCEATRTLLRSFLQVSIRW